MADDATKPKARSTDAAKPELKARPQSKPDPEEIARNVLARYPKIMARLGE
jgi:hypothetical protein